VWLLPLARAEYFSRGSRVSVAQFAQRELVATENRRCCRDEYPNAMNRRCCRDGSRKWQCTWSRWTGSTCWRLFWKASYSLRVNLNSVSSQIECQSRELCAAIRNSLYLQRPARWNRFLYGLRTPIAIAGKAHHSYSISIFKPPIRLPWKKLLLRCSVFSCSACEQGVLTRVNTITEVAYRDASTILSGEHINEPRCESDQSGYQFAGPWVFLSPELHFSLFS
jgi:hypothetical protein